MSACIAMAGSSNTGVGNILAVKYYVKKSGNIGPGDTLWDHGPGKNPGTHNATTEIDPDTGNRSGQMIGTAHMPIRGGEKIIVRGSGLIVDPTSKGAIPPGLVVGSAHLQAGAAGAPPPIPSRPLPYSPVKAPVAQPGGVDPNGAVPVDGSVAPADSLIGEALTRDPETGKPIKRPYKGDSWENYRRDDLWDMLKDAAR